MVDARPGALALSGRAFCWAAAELMAVEGHAVLGVDGPSLEEVVLQNSSQFYRWHTELEAARTLETEQKYRNYADALKGHLTSCNHLLEKVDSTLQGFDTLKTQHRNVSAKTRALHESCERLVDEKERLVEFAEALRAKLAYFDELERIASQFHSGVMAVDSDHFLPILHRLDECITYVASNPQYADSTAYAGKFRQLHGRALATVRAKVQQVMRHASEQVQAAIVEAKASSSGRRKPEGGSGAAANGLVRSGSGNAKVPLAEGAETALLYVRFRAAAEPGLKGLLAGVAARAKRPEYAQLLTDCQRVYCEVRLGLVAEITADRIAEYAREPLPSLTRSGCSYLMQVCQMEHQLFEHFFPESDSDSGALAPLMDPLCTVLYDALRPVFIQLQSLDELCGLVDILQHEVLEEQLGRRGDAVAPLRPVLLRTLADIQERLTFRAQAFIKEEVTGFQPKAEDLDYPNKLVRLAEQPDAAVPDSHADSLNAYTTWYPPVQQTLLCLSKLYRCVEAKVFAGLAQDAVSSCAATVQMAARAVGRRSSSMDGQLFLIKQLLILREQIAPFEADFSVTEKDLDFTHMRDHLRRILAGMLSLPGAPRLMENLIDSKKELEKLLKATCEVFIMAVTKLTVEPMLSFITKVTAVRVASSLNPGRRLREQAFAAPERLEEMAVRVREALQKELPAVVAKMRLYLNNPATHAILFKPIKSNIAEAHGQIASLLESEYTPEEAARVPLTSPQQLAALLDSLC
ncbi:Sec34-domain-containing protein [Coccomyxa subellipsoidea C-169]|uniref:Conserved oligomeric Golgi complex subunit 3 n=1 Tax=Coccomyxa subellipsoidea (strain C-169) TaxID=574566 RepID=I0YR63_COCSC|nr:Sec34-domain-containing protein [Coccomyxa subellipsoidea C-169]EIE20882.1 Sec34-domain-containing protein [Coccomyxa subellipsoidea C-169]|eukprot:XP_005645426.1 Sec34-domain-containing protein [Coccomyxa subellipsoidea C-169]